MSGLRRILDHRLVSDVAVSRVVQAAAFLAGPAVLMVALRALPRFASTRGELFQGVLASAAVALLLVVLGLVLPLAVRRSEG